MKDLSLFQDMSGARTVAQRLLGGGFHVNALRPWLGADGRAYITVNNQARMVGNATLLYDEWKAFDDVVMEAAYARPSAAKDLEDLGLTYPLTNGLASMLLQSQRQSDISAAEFSMTGDKRGLMDRPEYETIITPLPLAAKDFEISIRPLLASRQHGNPLDTTNAALAARKVAELIEYAVFNGTGITWQGGTGYGYLNHPDINTITMSSYTAHWNDSGATGATILALILAMKQASLDDLHYGPWMIYIPNAYETILDEDYDATSAARVTIRQRIKEVGGILDVKVSTSCPADKVVMVEMQKETVRLIDGLPYTTVQWDERGGMILDFKVMAIKVPEIRSSHGGKSGIVVAS